MACKSSVLFLMTLAIAIAFASCDQYKNASSLVVRPAGFPSEAEAEAAAQRWIETSEALFDMARKASKEWNITASKSVGSSGSRRMLASSAVPTCDCDYHAGG